jgi:hypothetical protein
MPRAVAESCFRRLWRERIRRRTYPARNVARRDVFEHIVSSDTPKRKRTNTGILSPVDFVLWAATAATAQDVDWVTNINDTGSDPTPAGGPDHLSGDGHEQRV